MSMDGEIHHKTYNSYFSTTYKTYETSLDVLRLTNGAQGQMKFVWNKFNNSDACFCPQG